MRFFRVNLPIFIVLIAAPFKLVFGSDSVDGIIRNILNAKKDSKTTQETTRREIIESLSNEEKEKVILRLINESEQGIYLQNSRRIRDLDYLNEVGSKRFRRM